MVKPYKYTCKREKTTVTDDREAGVVRVRGTRVPRARRMWATLTSFSHNVIVSVWYTQWGTTLVIIKARKRYSTSRTEQSSVLNRERAQLSYIERAPKYIGKEQGVQMVHGRRVRSKK